MVSFYVTEGFPLPIRSVGTKKCRMIDSEKIVIFWRRTKIKDLRGCYIFALKIGPGYTPYYVGKAAKQTFEKECINSHKLAYHYNPTILEKKGLPYLFFVVQRKTKGKWSASAIDDLEEHLIAYAAAKNPQLTNKRRLPNQQWSIEGVLSPRPGAPTKKAKLFKRTMGI